MGFIVSKDGIIIDTERSKAISKLGLPSSKKSMQSFLGKINFFRRFVPDFAQNVIPLQDIIKKYVVFKCSDIQRMCSLTLIRL